MSGELIFNIKRLEKLAVSCGVDFSGKAAGPQIDLTGMSAYEAGQYRVALQLKQVRETIAELDNLGFRASQTAKSALSQQIRKELRQVVQDVGGAVKTAAQAEGKKEQYMELMSHVKKTEQLYKGRFSKAIEEEDPTSGRNAGIEMKSLDEPLVSGASLRDDEEFQLFFEQTKQNDVLIDQAVDRITAGVQRLKDNANLISEELKGQEKLLEDTEKATDKVTTNLKGLNKRLKETLKSVDKDKMCIYVFCFVLLLGLAGGVYWVISDGKT